MQKIPLILVGLLLFVCAGAQKEKASFARLVKYDFKDSLLPVSKAVKNQLLQRGMDGKKNKAGAAIASPLRVIFTDTDRKKNDNAVRWLSSQTAKDVYKIDLAMVISKYIGETEKNLELLFARASEKNWILFFDEADALFGRSSTPEEKEDTDKSATYFFKRITLFKGEVLVNCTNENCFDALAKKGFIKVMSE